MQPILGGLLLLLLGLPVLFPGLSQWPLYFAVPLLAYFAVVLLIRPLRRSVGWLRIGQIDSGSLAATLGVIIAASFVLLLWFYATDADARSYAERLPVCNWTPLHLIWACVFFAVVNATLEEVVWRGVLMDALQAELGLLAGLVVQGVAFGAMHFRGFPSGILGVCLASIYGLMLGWLRMRSQGMLLPIIAHAAADATIFTVVVLES